jgi:hypothetical protein
VETGEPIELGIGVSQVSLLSPRRGPAVRDSCRAFFVSEDGQRRPWRVSLVERPSGNVNPADNVRGRAKVCRPNTAPSSRHYIGAPRLQNSRDDRRQEQQRGGG